MTLAYNKVMEFFSSHIKLLTVENELYTIHYANLKVAGKLCPNKHFTTRMQESLLLKFDIEFYKTYKINIRINKRKRFQG